MMKRLVIRSIVTWVAFIPVAVVNGAVRDRLYGPRVGELAAHQLSTVSASAAFVGLAYAMLRDVYSALNARSALTVGASWVVATIGFELWLGRFQRGATWGEMLADYNLRRGRVWGLFLVVIFATPSLTRWLVQIRRPMADG